VQVGPHPAVATCRRAVRELLKGLDTGSLVLVASSGGADSLALAAAIAFEAPRAEFRAGAVTVDHGLQPGSAERASAVATQLKRLGLDPVEIATVTVEPGGGPEAAARYARYRALDETAVRLGAAAIFLGHTRDDQAETVLLGLARGSGARSLAGMAPVSDDGRYRRPFLAVSRDTTRLACQTDRLQPWEDPHNTDHSYTRVRVRLEALPALERAAGPGVTEALARTAALLRADADALDTWAVDLLARAGGPTPQASPHPTPHEGHLHPIGRGEGALHASRDGAQPPLIATSAATVALDVAVLLEAPAAVRTRALRLAALAAGAPATDLSAVHVEALDVLLTDWHGQHRVDLPGPVKGYRRYGKLILATEGATQTNDS
jgi:tRNA(Ile)-lysidine synthase